MTTQFYRVGLADRRRLLADDGFVRDDLHIWSHPDGRTIGEGVAVALTDEAFFRFLKLEPALAREPVAEDEAADARTTLLGY